MEKNAKKLGRLVRSVREQAEQIDLRAFPPAKGVPETELAAIQNTATQMLESVECILGMRGPDAQGYFLSKEPLGIASELLAGLVLLHKGMSHELTKEDR